MQSPDPVINSQVLLGIITTIGGIVTTYLTLKLRTRVQQRNRDRQPKDRMETIFDGYESLIKQQQIDIDRKQSIIQSLEDIIERLQQELNDTRSVLNSAKNELKTTQGQNRHLQDQLAKMKREYAAGKTPNQQKGV